MVFFYQNWSESKVQLGENIERMLTGEEKAPAEIPGNFFYYFVKSADFYQLLCEL